MSKADWVNKGNHQPNDSVVESQLNEAGYLLNRSTNAYSLE